MKYYRKDTDSIDKTPARELAAELIDNIQRLSTVPDGDAYFDLEDSITEVINNWFKSKE